MLFGPHILLNTAAIRLYCLVSKEPSITQVTPTLFFGRRLLARECLTGQWIGVLDLAAEFTEARPFRELVGYRSMPVLDGTCPTEEQLRSAVVWLNSTLVTGPVYVHCALGHGRSACVVIAFLLSMGEVNTVESGEQRLRILRPGVRLNGTQRHGLQVFTQQHTKGNDVGNEVQ